MRNVAISREPTLVKWIAPPLGFFKLNTDGSLNYVTGHASAGGIIRDISG